MRIQETQETTRRNVILASADPALRGRLRNSLVGMRWRVREASGGAEAIAHMEEQRSEALLVDNWLPDLEVGQFAGHIRTMFPAVEMLQMDGDSLNRGISSPRRHELLHAMREAQEPVRGESAPPHTARSLRGIVAPLVESSRLLPELPMDAVPVVLASAAALLPAAELLPAAALLIPGMIGSGPCMLELVRLIRLVAPRSTTVLIEGETGSGKEVVAHALHQLSSRSQRSFGVLNCAAIPEALLEAELFGHTRGAFTGAVQARTGRIEAANGGTLFLDEIGEMALPLQAKMLRFLENGELQRVGENEITRVDVRIIAATHQHLAERSAAGMFRLDLYHRLAVFPLEVPALRDHSEDIAELAEHFLAALGKDQPRKRLSAVALALLLEHAWPGNVRELAHVLERAVILAGDSPEIGVDEVRYRKVLRQE